jgi:hypothetical protein
MFRFNNKTKAAPEAPLLFVMIFKIYRHFCMPKYSKKAQSKVGKVIHEFKEGKLKSGYRYRLIRSSKARR